VVGLWRLFPLAAGVALRLSARFFDRVGKGTRDAPRDALVADLTPERFFPHRHNRKLEQLAETPKSRRSVPLCSVLKKQSETLRLHRFRVWQKAAKQGSRH
jgi:hypothetical protein